MTRLSSAALPLAALSLLAFAARADQCIWMSKDAAEAAHKLLHKGAKFVHYCQPCGDRQPSPVLHVESVEVQPASDANYFELHINGKAEDTAYIYLAHGKDFANLATLAKKCPVQDVPAKIAVSERHDNKHGPQSQHAAQHKQANPPK